MNKPEFKSNLSTIEDIIERHILDIMTAQRFIDRETALERDQYGLAIKSFDPEIQEALRPVIPPRPVLVNSTLKLNVSISTFKSKSAGLHARLLNTIEVAGFDIYRETRTTVGNSLTIEINQMSLHSNKSRKEKNHE